MPGDFNLQEHRYENLNKPQISQIAVYSKNYVKQYIRTVGKVHNFAMLNMLVDKFSGW
jgi:hypothetical protein